MPKEEIDYSNTIFYKISCKNPSVSGIYIGHTTNFVQRKHAHKQSCKNPKTTNHNCKLYQVMRENDGWDNWNMEIIAFHACEDSYSARKQEQHYFEQYNATLNSIEPLPKPRPKPTHVKKEKIIHHCNTCKISFSSINLHELHNKTKKHSTNLKLANIQRGDNTATFKFICDKCDYSCSKKGDFNKHLRSKKHNTTNTTAIQQQLSYTCECGKVYNHRASLYNHKKKCTHTEPAEEEETTTSKDPLSEQPMFLQMIIQYFETLRQSEQEQRKSEQEQMGNMMKEIVKGNQEATKELVNKFIEIAPKMGNNTTNNNNNNNDNRKITFNYYLENNCEYVNTQQLTNQFDETTNKDQIIHSLLEEHTLDQ